MYRLFLPASSPDYAFTEIRTFHISQESNIEDPETFEGNVWSNTIQTYIACPETGLLWWGRLLEDKSVVKLVADWKNEQSYSSFIHSVPFQDVQATWKSLVTSEVKISLYALPLWPYSHEHAFSASDTVSAILTFRFPVSFDPMAIDPSDAYLSKKKDVWQSSWDMLSHTALRTEGGIVSSGSVCGWSVHSKFCTEACSTFIGIFRWRSIESFKSYLSEVVDKPTVQGGMQKLMEMADNDLSVEFTNMYCFKNGWQGGVTKTVDEEASRLFRERMRKLFPPSE